MKLSKTELNNHLSLLGELSQQAYVFCTNVIHTSRYSAMLTRVLFLSHYHDYVDRSFIKVNDNNNVVSINIY